MFDYSTKNGISWFLNSKRKKEKNMKKQKARTCILTLYLFSLALKHSGTLVHGHSIQHSHTHMHTHVVDGKWRALCVIKIVLIWGGERNAVCLQHRRSKRREHAWSCMNSTSKSAAGRAVRICERIDQSSSCRLFDAKRHGLRKHCGVGRMYIYGVCLSLRARAREKDKHTHMKRLLAGMLMSNSVPVRNTFLGIQ